MGQSARGAGIQPRSDGTVGASRSLGAIVWLLRVNDEHLQPQAGRQDGVG